MLISPAVSRQYEDITVANIDTKLLAILITELNIARRNSIAYPKGHPVIAASLAKALHTYDELLKKDGEIYLGITSDALMVDGIFLEKSNLVFRDFARVLFEHSIGALIFHPNLNTDELSRFIIILGLKREQIKKHGGIEQIWDKAAIRAISVKSIRYDLFQSTDENNLNTCDNSEAEEGLWSKFAKVLTRGELPINSYNNQELDPEILAAAINLQFADNAAKNNANITAALKDFVVCADKQTAAGGHPSDHHKKFASFISNLSPELRRQFLGSSFGEQTDQQHTKAEYILTNLSDKAILDTLEDINQNRLNVSTTVFGLLQRLGRNASRQEQETVSAEFADDDIAGKMKTILREHDSEEFVPDDYQLKLNYIIATDQIPRLEMEEVSDLLRTMDNYFIENSISQILINIIRDGFETPEERDLLLQNLTDMFSFFLQTGDYIQMHKMIDQLSDGTFPLEIQNRLRDEYGRREFQEEILDGLIVWGKPRYEDIRLLIHKIGGIFAEAILDRLSEEQNMSLRRFYMDCLIEMGPQTRIPIANRLYDKRWYFLRNLLLILTAQNDPSVVPLIQPLLKSDDPRLRNEALKALVHFHDSHAEKQILDDLDSHNLETQGVAIQLAERCTDPAVASKLVQLLFQGGYSQHECDRKSAIIHTLGEIGRAEILPELAKIMGSKSLLHSRQLIKLKTEIIRSLPKYSSAVSIPILKHIAVGSGELAQLAGETLKIITGKNI